MQAMGFSIESGMTVDARIVRSASKPVSSKKLETLRQEHKTEDSKTDQNGKPVKFQRDVESDWTFKNEMPTYHSRAVVRPLNMKKGQNGGSKHTFLPDLSPFDRQNRPPDTHSKATWNII